MESKEIEKKNNLIYIVVTPFFPTPDSFRGPFVYDQVRAIKTVRDYEVVVFKPTFLYDRTASYIYEGIKVYLFPTAQTPSYLFNGLFNEYNAKSFVRTFLSIGYNPQNVIAVHCHTSTLGACGLELKKINSKIKVFLQHHDKDPFTILNGKLSGWKLNSRYRAKKNIDIFNSVDVHVCISRACEANLLAFPHAPEAETYQPYLNKLKRLQGLPQIKPKKTVVLYNGVDTSKFYPKKKSSDRNSFVIGCVANFISLKGQDDLIKAFAVFVKEKNIENTLLRFVGTGPTQKRCELLCSKLGIREIVEFNEETSHSQLIDFYNNIDLFILPSHFDGFGCVCLEAYSCGVPFIIPYNQGAFEYIADVDNHHWSYRPGDITQLTRIISDYYENRRLEQLKYDIDINMIIEEFLMEVML